MLAPVAEKLGIDLVWFGVLLAVNMQTSFMHPPFGFALFYLRSVAPHDDYKDRVTGRPIAKITTGQIYWGAVPYVVIQIVMVGLIITFPGIVSRDTAKAADNAGELLQQQIEQQRQQRTEPPPLQPGEGAASGAPGAASDAPAQPDPMADLLRAVEEEKRRAASAPADKK
jgi:hypothetical protein